VADLQLVQMSGAPGAGKTTIARALVRRRRLVALDHDVVKTALLESGGTFASTGAASYRVLLALAGDVLDQGYGVVIDSPCFYDKLVEAGQRLAAQHRAVYRYIECVTDDIGVLDERLRSRPRRRSQRPSIDVPPVDLAAGTDRDGMETFRDGTELFRDWIASMKRPAAYLRLDTARPVGECVADALAYLDGPP